MPKRAMIPQGKALFFRSNEAVTEAVHESDTRDQSTGERGESNVDVDVRARSKPTTRQSAIFLEERHIDWLEDRCREARKNGGRAIRKAAIIRALLDVGMESGIDLSGLKREEDLKARVRDALSA